MVQRKSKYYIEKHLLFVEISDLKLTLKDSTKKFRIAKAAKKKH